MTQARKFRSDEEVKVEFSCGRLPWVRGDTPVLLHLKQDAHGRTIIHSHQLVRVLDTCGLSAAHEPVYHVETEGGDLIEADSAVLVPWTKLMLNEAGNAPSEYAKLLKARDLNRRTREMAGFRTEIFEIASFGG